MLEKQKCGREKSRNIPKIKRCLIGFLLLFYGVGYFTAVMAQSEKQITGRVTDAKGELLIGVSIVEVGTSNNAGTDANGTYVIKTNSENPSLKFTYIGFKDKLIEIGKRTVVDVALDEDLALLDEVVVVGFGTQKKASVIGAISSIDPEKLNLTPSRSLSNNLAGLVSGVIAVQRSGNPWFNNSDFWIRGISSFRGNTAPLVLVDGIERSLHDIDPEEIESFSVLKDASASAVYGVRGANGVVMITTKRGKIGKPQVDVRFERSYTAPVRIPEFIGSVKYLELMNEMYSDTGRDPFATEATLLNYKNQTDPELYPDINWWNTIAKDYADNLKGNVSVNGGSDILRYAMVLGYYSENGIIKRDPNQEWNSSLKVDRYTVRTNLDINITPTTLLRVNLGGFLQTRSGPPDDTNKEIFFQAMRIPPYIHPPIYADGKIPRIFAKQNPWAMATQRGYEKLNASKIESLTSIEQDLKFILQGLSAKLSFSFDKYMENSVVRAKDPDYYNPASGRDENGNLITTLASNGQQFLGYGLGAKWGDQSVYFESMLNYNRVFNRKHDVNVMLLYNQKNFDKGLALPYRNQGFAGRFSYSYDKRYVTEFNFGYNGSENFAKGKRFGFFPSVALGWIVSQESFMESLSDQISNLKIRGSWGEAGNSEIGEEGYRRFAYLATIANVGEYWWGVSDPFYYRLGKAEGEIGVDNLTWETVAKKNIGVDIGLWKNAINLTVDVFKENRRDIFMERINVPGSAGFIRNIWANYGKVDNQGIDMSLNIGKQLNKDWYVSALANYSVARNKIVEYDEPTSIVGTHRARTGRPVSQLFGLIAEGLFTEDDFDGNGKLKGGIPIQNFSDVNNLRPGDIKYKDLNGDGVITTDDETAIGGTHMPEIVYGFGATVKYRHVDVGFLFNGLGNTDRMLGGENWIPGSVLGAGNIFSNIDDRWTKDNPSDDVFWPRLGDRAVANNERPSTFWLKDMSCMRLKNIELGYTLNQPWTKKAGVRDVRIFLRGTNLLTFSKFKLWDPELDVSNGMKYPQMKSVSMGLSVNFIN